LAVWRNLLPYIFQGGLEPAAPLDEPPLCGNTGKLRAVPAKQKNTSSNKKTKSQKYANNQTRKPNHKYANKKQNNQSLGKQSQPSCVNNGSMYNRVKKSME